MELAAGDRVRSLRGSCAGATGTVVKCGAHYALVDFADNSTAPPPRRRSTRRRGSASRSAPTKKHKKTLELCTPAAFGTLPVDLAEKIMGLLLLDKDVGLMAAIGTCRRWREAPPPIVSERTGRARRATAWGTAGSAAVTDIAPRSIGRVSSSTPPRRGERTPRAERCADRRITRDEDTTTKQSRTRGYCGSVQ